MPTSQLNKEQILLDDGKDAIVIVKALTDIPGGRSLDVADFADAEVIKAGHILVQDKSTKAISPLAISSGAYVTLPEGKSYCGVLMHSVLVRDPRASILTSGQVNAAASPYTVTAEIKAGLPRVEFIY